VIAQCGESPQAQAVAEHWSGLAATVALGLICAAVLAGVIGVVIYMLRGQFR
jgi:hypothetical protein